MNSKAVTEKGFNIIHAPSDHFYLDCGQGGWLGNSQGASWCPFVTWLVHIVTVSSDGPGKLMVCASQAKHVW